VWKVVTLGANWLSGGCSTVAESMFEISKASEMGAVIMAGEELLFGRKGRKLGVKLAPYEEFASSTEKIGKGGIGG
jgi:hypothetical protein